MKPTLVLAIGNPSRGDDALGPLLFDQLGAWLVHQPQGTQDAIDLLCELQLQPEHVYDLQGRDRVLFIDASVDGTPDVCCTPLAETPTAPSISSHQCSPAALINWYRQLFEAPPPACHLLTLPGQAYELGAPLTAQAEGSLAQGWHLLLQWLNAPLEAQHA